MPVMTKKQVLDENAMLRHVVEQQNIRIAALEAEIVELRAPKLLTDNALRPVTLECWRSLLAQVAKGEYADAKAVISQVAAKFGDDAAKMLRRRLWQTATRSIPQGLRA